MKTIRIDRLFHGFASVRDYQVEEAKVKHEDIKVVLDKEYMIIPFEKLDQGFKNKEIFKSKHKDGQTYSLIDYDWVKPKKETVQFDLFTSLQNI